MAQPSVAQFFNSRKRSAVDEIFAAKARKVLIVDKKDGELNEPCIVPVWTPKIIEKAEPVKAVKLSARRRLDKVNAASTKKKVNLQKQHTLDGFMKSKAVEEPTEKPKSEQAEKIETVEVAKPDKKEKIVEDAKAIKTAKKELNLEGVQQKLTRSEKLAELKASLFRFKQADAKLKDAESKTKTLIESKEKLDIKKLKSFKSIELEVNLSPQKVQSPEKCYLSPKRDITPRKLTFSPVKNANSCRKSLIESLEKPGLALPYKYRYLAEIFRSIDTVCKFMHNRQEVITFTKLKPAVEEMLKRNLYEKHLAQIKSIYPEAFTFKLEKLRVYGAGSKREEWELVVQPKIEGSMTAEVLLERRRTLFNILVNKTKVYHHEFLQSLPQAINIPLEKITRWHPEFDLEKVPDIEQSDLPKPVEEKIITGKEVLERAKGFLGVNKRLDAALERLKTNNDLVKPEVKIEPEENSILKGIPKALLEKVRARQAAKALESMTRSSTQQKEYETFIRLPELVRFTRNVFVTEKKSVLPLETVLNKLENSYTRTVKQKELEEHLQLLAKDFPELLVFHNIRNVVYLKLQKNTDVNAILKVLDEKIKEKSG